MLVMLMEKAVKRSEATAALYNKIYNLRTLWRSLADTYFTVEGPLGEKETVKDWDCRPGWGFFVNQWV